MDRHDISPLFEPQSVAVIGASRDRTKVGYSILRNILHGGYIGKVFAVNPNGGRALGQKMRKSLEEIPDEIDIVVISVPSKLVYGAIRSCVKKKVKFALIIASGFSEVGNIEEERRIVDYARAQGLRVLGPNIFGIYSAVTSLNATFGPEQILPGSVAIITQSGALGLAMIGKTAVESIGLSAMVSVGNKADIDEADLLEYLVPQERTRIILMYIEGVKGGERLIEALKRTTKEKPVIVIKSGRSAKGAIAAASHTGSLAGSDDVFDDVMSQCGVLRAESIKEAFNWCKFLSNNPLPSGEDTVIITNGGGIGVLAADACEKHGVKLYDDTRRLKETFSPLMPDFGSTKNPVDITGQATSALYTSAFDAARKDSKINSVIGLYCETAVFDAENLSRMIGQTFIKYRSGKKPIVFSLFGGEDTENYMTSLGKQGVSVFDDVYEAVGSLGAMYRYYRYRQEPPGEIETADISVTAIHEIVAQAKGEGRTFLLADEAQRIMHIAGIAVPRSMTAHSIDEAARAAEETGYPVALKIVSRDIIHKSDAGGVALDLDNRQEVIDAFEAITRSCRSAFPNAVLEGMQVTEMVTAGTEIIVGARIDRDFGPIVMVGLGGIYVEVMKDVTFRALPLDRKEILHMIKEIRSYPLLLGVRGERTRDIDSLVDAIIRLGTIISRCRGITDIEINPLVVYEEGLGSRAVDTRILLSRD